MPRFPGLQADGITFENPGIPDDLTKKAAAKVATDMGTEGTPTRTALNAAIAKKPLPTGDQTAALQAFLNDAGVLGVRQVVGDFTVAGTVTIPAGVYVDMSKATITQTTAKTATLSAGSGASIMGGTLIGLGTDYAPHAGGSLTIDAVGILVAGAGVTITDTTFQNHGRAAIYNPSHDDLHVIRPNIRGVHGNGATTIPAGDIGCFGIYLGGGDRPVITSPTISHTAIGVISAMSVDQVRITGAYLHTIPGQHGLYLQNGTGLHVDGVDGHDIEMNLVKVQLDGTLNTQSYGGTVSNITGRNVKDSVLSVNATATTLTAASSRYNGFTISNITGYQCGRVAYVGNVRGGTITGITGVGTVIDDLILVDVQDLAVSTVAGRGTGRGTVFITTKPGAQTQRVTLTGVRSRNAGIDGLAGYANAVMIACANDGADGRDITLDGVEISADNGTLAYGLWFQSGHQESLRVRNLSIGTGSVATAGVRLASATRMVAEWNNIDMGGSARSTFPSGLPIRTGSIGYSTRWASNTLPTAGAYAAGDHVDRSVLSAGESPGWKCVVAGGAYSKTRANSTAYTAGEWIKATSTAHVYEVTTAGTSGATEPTPPALNGTVTDGTAVLTLRATSVATFRALAPISAT